VAALPGVMPPFAIADADVERGELRVDAKARLYDALEVMRAFFCFAHEESSARRVQGDRAGGSEKGGLVAARSDDGVDFLVGLRGIRGGS
jgi:hypothetical protein